MVLRAVLFIFLNMLTLTSTGIIKTAGIFNFLTTKMLTLNHVCLFAQVLMFKRGCVPVLNQYVHVCMCAVITTSTFPLLV